MKFFALKNENSQITSFYDMQELTAFCLFFSGLKAGEGDLEAMKQEILREMRKEIQKAKQEIIDGTSNLYGSLLTIRIK